VRLAVGTWCGPVPRVDGGDWVVLFTGQPNIEGGPEPKENHDSRGVHHPLLANQSANAGPPTVQMKQERSPKTGTVFHAPLSTCKSSCWVQAWRGCQVVTGLALKVQNLPICSWCCWCHTTALCSTAGDQLAHRAAEGSIYACCLKPSTAMWRHA